MWTRLINTSDNHYKFYSVEWKGFGGSRKKLTGKVMFGRIGSAGIELQFTPSKAKQKYTQKLAKGYRKLNQSTSGVVFSEEVLVMEWA